MIRPTRKCIILAVAGIPVALLPALVDKGLSSLWVAAVAGGFLMLGLDAISILRRSQLDVSVRLPDILYIGDSEPLVVGIDAGAAARGVTVAVLPELGEILLPQPERRIAVPSGGAEEVTFPLVPLRRGAARVDAVWLRWDGPMGLVRRILRHPVAAEVPVVPNLRAVRAAAIRFFRSRDSMSGLKAERYVGDGSEFDSLREYRPGLDHHAMDWKASARHKKLIVREYRAERNHQIVLAFDTGHLMSEPVAGIPRLDHAINAGLLLTFAALKTGDRVGLYAFDENVRVFARPRGGLAALEHHQRLTSELEYSTGETNFTLGLVSLSARLSRRSLLILFTEFVDTVTVELMLEHMERLAKRHLVICVTLRDPEVARIADARPEDLSSLNRAVVAGGLKREREVVLRRLGRLGVHCIDSPAEAVTSRLIDRYLEIKRRELV